MGRDSRIADDNSSHDAGHGAWLGDGVAPKRQDQGEGRDLEGDEKGLIKADMKSVKFSSAGIKAQGTTRSRTRNSTQP